MTKTMTFSIPIKQSLIKNNNTIIITSTATEEKNQITK